MAEGPRPGVGELRPPQGHHEGPAAEHRLRGCPLPEHRRVLAPRDGDVHDPRRRLHAGVLVLRGGARAADGTRHRGAGARRGGCGADAAAIRRHHIGGPRRPGGWRRVDLCRHDRADAGARAWLPDRGADSGFQGVESSLRTVLDAGPDVLNHNIETVPRLYRMARSGGRYPRSLELLDRSRQYRPGIATKTGIMVGLGEDHDEIVGVFDDLRRVGVSILTIGQYLRPSAKHAAMTRYYHPDEFADLKRIALAKGFVHVESGPLVRSSYHAHEQADAFQAHVT